MKRDRFLRHRHAGTIPVNGQAVSRYNGGQEVVFMDTVLPQMDTTFFFSREEFLKLTSYLSLRIFSSAHLTNFRFLCVPVATVTVLV